MSVAEQTKTLAKFGAHLRWLIEQSGVNPERCTASIIVPNAEAEAKLIDVFKKNYDAKIMKRDSNHPSVIVVHGVAVVITISLRKENA